MGTAPFARGAWILAAHSSLCPGTRSGLGPSALGTRRASWLQMDATTPSTSMTPARAETSEATTSHCVLRCRRAAWLFYGIVVGSCARATKGFHTFGERVASGIIVVYLAGKTTELSWQDCHQAKLLFTPQSVASREAGGLNGSHMLHA